MSKFKEWGIKTRTFKDKNYHAVWLGESLQTHRLCDNPQQLSPGTQEFYDVSLGTMCNLECPFCYVSAKKQGRLYTDIVDKAEKFFGSMDSNTKPFQVAIGSESEATIHPDFIQFIEKIHSLGIVPNYTTNGITLAADNDYTEKLLQATEKYCGGVAISCNNFNENIDKIWRKALEKLSTVDININLHIIISDKDSVDRFVDIYNNYADKVYYFVLLPLMPSGRSKEKYTEEAFQYLLERSKEIDMQKVAFGAHFYEMLNKYEKYIKTYKYPPEHFSANLIMDNPIRVTPSSFDINTTLLSINYESK